ncbi:MAG: LapA family protein [Deltaproteobacteria bacterium]|nr:LapA family protein [Deltaproteobacteria bacterium]
MSGSLITIMVVVIIIGIYVVGNIPPVEVRFLFWETQISKAVLTLVPLMAGIILGFVIAQIDRFKKERKKARQKRRKKGG